MVGIRLILAAAVSLLSLASAQDSSTGPTRQLTLSNCADDSGFKSCQTNANTALDKCLQTAKGNGNHQTDILACGCLYYTQNINCAATSCWNRVNECNYQIFVTGFLTNCPTAAAPIPYFGFDKDAQDACSCNLAQIYLETTAAVTYSGKCSNNANGPDAANNVQQIQGCMCCAVSAPLSSIANNCPKTDPNLVGLAAAKQLQTNLNANFNDCATYLTKYDCVNGLGFPKLANGAYRTPSTLGNFGTDKLTNTGGTVSKPALGEKFSWTNKADGVTYNIVSQGLGKAPSSSSSSSGSSGSSTSGDTSSSGSPSASSGSSGDSKKNGASGFSLSAIGMAVPALLMLISSC